MQQQQRGEDPRIAVPEGVSGIARRQRRTRPWASACPRWRSRADNRDPNAPRSAPSHRRRSTISERHSSRHAARCCSSRSSKPAARACDRQREIGLRIAAPVLARGGDELVERIGLPFCTLMFTFKASRYWLLYSTCRPLEARRAAESPPPRPSPAPVPRGHRATGSTPSRRRRPPARACRRDTRRRRGPGVAGGIATSCMLCAATASCISSPLSLAIGSRG